MNGKPGLILALFGALLLAACSGSDDKPVASNTATTQAPAAQGQQAPAATQAGAAAPAATGGQTATKLDPCALLTKAEAERLAGEPVKDGQPRDSGPPLGQQFCGYEAVAERSSRLVQLSLVSDAGFSADLRRGGQTAKSVFTNTKAGAANARAVPGVGEEAFTFREGALEVLQKDVYVTLSVTGGAIGRMDQPVTTEALAAAARTVIDRLPR